MVKSCSKCNTPFNCKNEDRGCWCEDITLSAEVLRHLKENYDNCLCPSCLQDEKDRMKEEASAKTSYKS